MCYAEFLRYYYLTQITTTKENDYKPEELTDHLIQENHTFQHNCLNVIPLMSSKEKLTCCKIPNLLQYYKPNRHVHPEKYYHHILFMCYPFRREEELKTRGPPKHSQTFNEPEVAGCCSCEAK